jgi:hypothetical protein
MVHWLEQNPDDDVKASRGDQRQQYLIAYLVHQMRNKGAQKVVQNERVLAQNTVKNTDTYWWSKEQMDLQVGPKKSQTWRESGKLKSRPDSVTGSTEEHMLEWCVPVSWVRNSNEDGTSLKVKAEGEAGEAELELLEGAASDSAEVAKVVKQEQKSPEELEKEKCDALVKAADTNYRRFQEYILESKVDDGPSMLIGSDPHSDHRSHPQPPLSFTHPLAPH